MESTRHQSKIFTGPSAPAPVKNTAKKTGKKTTGKTTGKKTNKKLDAKNAKRDKRSSWVASFVLYPESACLDADPAISKQEAIYNAIANRTRHDLTGFISPLHDHDAQRKDYKVGEDDNNKNADENGVIYAGAMTMFAHLAGAALAVLEDAEKLKPNALDQYELVRRTLDFLEKDHRFNYDRTTIKTTMAYYIERFVDNVLIPAPASAWKELQVEAPDFFRSPESKIMVVEETSDSGKKKKKQIMPDEDGYVDPDPEGLTWAHVPDYKTFQEHAYKKPHYHVVLINTGYKAISKKGWQHAGLRYWGDLSGGLVELVLSDVRNMYKYMTHESDKARVDWKHVYNSNDILELPGFTLEDYDDISKEQRRKILGLAQDFGQVIYDLKQYGFKVYCDPDFHDFTLAYRGGLNPSPDTFPHEQYEYIKSNEDLEWYWGHADLIGVCNNLTRIIDNIKDIIVKKHAVDLKREEEKITKLRNDLEDENRSSMWEYDEEAIEAVELEIETDNIRFEGDFSVLENDKKRLKNIKKLVEDQRWPDEVELRRSILAYRNSYKDIYDTQRQLEREITKIREDNGM